jgi:hypothetical protein
LNTLDSLMQRAHQNLSGYAPSQDEPDDEAMMDFLAGRREFMLSIEQAAQTALGRRSHGVGDAEFEDAMVRFMDAVQRRIASGRAVPPPARLPRVAVGAAAFATLAAVVAVIMLLAVSSGGSGNSPVVLQVTAIPQASESVSTPIATKPVTTPIASKPESTPAPAPAKQTPTPLASPGSSAQVSAQPGEQGKLTAATPPTGSAVEGQAATPTSASVAPKPLAVAAEAVPVLAPASAPLFPVSAGTAVTAALARPAAASPDVLRPAASPAVVRPAPSPAVVRPAPSPAVLRPAPSPAVLRAAPSTPKPAAGKDHPKKRNRP